MIDETVQYLDSNRKIVFEYDVSELVDVAIEVWTFIKETIQEKYNKTLIIPTVIFDGNESESLDFDTVTLRLQKEHKKLDLHIFKDMSGVSFYYLDSPTFTYKSHWYKSGTPLTDWFADTLLLFTE